MSQFKPVKDNVFIGPQPSPDDLEDARQLGIKTVIDFRLPAETASPNETLAKRCGLDYINIPVSKALPSERQIDDLEVAMQTQQGPFLLHCATGARAVLLLALSTARKNGWTAEQTFVHAQTMGFDLRTSPAFSSFVHQVTSAKGRQADTLMAPKGT